MYVSRITAALAATTLLTACQMNGMHEQKDPLIPATTRAALTDTCGAGDLTFMAGMRVAEVEFDTAQRPVRIVGPKSAVTTDYQPERLNVKIDASDRITGFSCS